MPEINELVCKECGTSSPVAPVAVCEFCFGPLEPVFDYAAISAGISRESIERGPHTLWRYAALLPVGDDARRVDLAAGLTPLLRAERLGEAIGLENLYLKNDTANPTHSFKDRVVSVAATAARAFGFDTMACASTGNLGNAVAAHAARAGMRSFVFIPGDLESGKVLATGVHGARIVAVKGTYDDVNRLCSQAAGELPWAFVNVNLRPFYSEGSKTLAYEIVEQLGWRAPDHVVVPVASGAMLTMISKGLKEMVEVGLIESERTHVHAAQPAGCSPIATAIISGEEEVRPVKPNTIVKSLAIGDPADGYYAAAIVRARRGSASAVEDSEVVEAIELLSSLEGIFAETAGGVTVAALRRLAAAGVFSPEDIVVALVTGTGLKTAEIISERVRPAMEILPTMEAFEQALGLIEGGE